MSLINNYPAFFIRMQDFLLKVITIVFIKNSQVFMQPSGFLYASSPRFFIGYWILQRGWVSTRPLLFKAFSIGEIRRLFQLITIVLNSLSRIAIEVYTKDKAPILYTRDFDQHLHSFSEYECPAPAYSPAIKEIFFRLLYFLLLP